MKRIHICGIYGSGKSNLAKGISKFLSIPVYSLDDIKYEIKYSKVRPVEERIRRIKEICKKEYWIIEGTWSDYAEEAFRSSDFVILMIPSKILCSYRVLKRHLARKKEENDTLIETIKLVREIYRYYKKNRPVSLITHKEFIKKYNKKHFIIKNNSDIRRLFVFLRN